jgi:hypothetical protein
MRRSGEETLPGVMIPIHAGMGDASEGAEVAFVRGQQMEVWTRCLASLREEKCRHHSQRHMDGEQAPRRKLISRTSDGRQGKTSAGGAEEVAAVHG